MKEKKQIKRLVLKKEEIVNLNEYEMRNLVGGEYGISKTLIKLSKYVYDAYKKYSKDTGRISVVTEGINDSWAGGCNDNDMSDISKKQYLGGCLLPDVNVYG